MSLKEACFYNCVYCRIVLSVNGSTFHRRVTPHPNDDAAAAESSLDFVTYQRNTL